MHCTASLTLALPNSLKNAQNSLRMMVSNLLVKDNSYLPHIHKNQGRQCSKPSTDSEKFHESSLTSQLGSVALAQNTLFPNIFFDEFPYRGIKLISMTPPLYTPDSVEFFVISLKLSTLKPDPLLRKWEAAARMVVVTRRTRMAMATPRMLVSNCSFASSLVGN